MRGDTVDLIALLGLLLLGVLFAPKLLASYQAGQQRDTLRNYVQGAADALGANTPATLRAEQALFAGDPDAADRFLNSINYDANSGS